MKGTTRRVEGEGKITCNARLHQSQLLAQQLSTPLFKLGVLRTPRAGVLLQLAQEAGQGSAIGIELQPTQLGLQVTDLGLQLLLDGHKGLQGVEKQGG